MNLPRQLGLPFDVDHPLLAQGDIDRNPGGTPETIVPQVIYRKSVYTSHLLPGGADAKDVLPDEFLNAILHQGKTPLPFLQGLLDMNGGNRGGSLLSGPVIGLPQNIQDFGEFEREFVLTAGQLTGVFHQSGQPVGRDRK